MGGCLRHKIGIISDTHDLLRPEVLENLSGCERILHAGDCSSPEIIAELEKIAPVTVVCGNNDRTKSRLWSETLPQSVDFFLYGLHIFMVHNKKDLPADLSPYDLVIYGHSHKYDDRTAGSPGLFNPGSCGPRRFHQEITMAIMEIFSPDNVKVEKQSAEEMPPKTFIIHKIIIPHPGKDQKAFEKGKSSGKIAQDNQTSIKNSNDENLQDNQTSVKNNGKKSIRQIEASPEDLKLYIEPKIPVIMKDLAGGKSVSQIARKYQITEELSAEITRMYLTHPGVDADGILRRLGL